MDTEVTAKGQLLVDSRQWAVIFYGRACQLPHEDAGREMLTSMMPGHARVSSALSAIRSPSPERKGGQGVRTSIHAAGAEPLAFGKWTRET